MIGPSALTAIQTARKARLQRFAEAAYQHESKGRTLADIQQAEMLEALLVPARSPLAEVRTIRREYETKHRPSIFMPVARRILGAVAAEFDMSIEEMLEHNNEPKYCIPRYVAVGLMLEATRLSFYTIGRWMGGRDHSTIHNARRRIAKLLESEAFRNRFDQIKAAVA